MDTIESSVNAKQPENFNTPIFIKFIIESVHYLNPCYSCYQEAMLCLNLFLKTLFFFSVYQPKIVLQNKRTF